MFDKREAIQSEAFTTLARLTPAGCFAPLIAAYEGSSTKMQAEILNVAREAVVESERRAPDKIVELAEKCLASKDPLIRENGANLLRDSGAKKVVPKLKKALLSEKNREVRESLRYAIEELSE